MNKREAQKLNNEILARVVEDSGGKLELTSKSNTIKPTQPKDKNVSSATIEDVKLLIQNQLIKRGLPIDIDHVDKKCKYDIERELHIGYISRTYPTMHYNLPYFRAWVRFADKLDNPSTLLRECLIQLFFYSTEKFKVTDFSNIKNGIKKIQMVLDNEPLLHMYLDDKKKLKKELNEIMCKPIITDNMLTAFLNSLSIANNMRTYRDTHVIIRSNSIFKSIKNLSNTLGISNEKADKNDNADLYMFKSSYTIKDIENKLIRMQSLEKLEDKIEAYYRFHGTSLDHIDDDIFVNSISIKQEKAQGGSYTLYSKEYELECPNFNDEIIRLRKILDQYACYHRKGEINDYKKLDDRPILKIATLNNAINLVQNIESDKNYFLDLIKKTKSLNTSHIIYIGSESGKEEDVRIQIWDAKYKIEILDYELIDTNKCKGLDLNVICNIDEKITKFSFSIRHLNPQHIWSVGLCSSCNKIF